MGGIVVVAGITFVAADGWRKPAIVGDDQHEHSWKESGVTENERECLELSRDQMTTIGYQVDDRLVDHFVSLSQQPVGAQTASREEMEAHLREPPPEQGSDVAAALAQLERDVWTNMMHTDHPRFFTFVPSPSNFISAMADALVAGLNPFAGTWLEASGPTQVELVTVDWLRQLLGLPETAGGHFVSGGSMANLTALAVARHTMTDNQGGATAVVYFSDRDALLSRACAENSWDLCRRKRAS